MSRATCRKRGTVAKERPYFPVHWIHQFANENTRSIYKSVTGSQNYTTECIIAWWMKSRIREQRIPHRSLAFICLLQNSVRYSRNNITMLITISLSSLMHANSICKRARVIQMSNNNYSCYIEKSRSCLHNKIWRSLIAHLHDFVYREKSLEIRNHCHESSSPKESFRNLPAMPWSLY